MLQVVTSNGYFLARRDVVRASSRGGYISEPAGKQCFLCI